MSQAAGGSSNNKSGARRKCADRSGAAKDTVGASGSDGVMERAGDGDSGGMERAGDGDGRATSDDGGNGTGDGAGKCAGSIAIRSKQGQ